MTLQQQNAAAIGPRNTIGATRFVSSKMFSNIFADGMALVEETANYLDGEGRDAARDLDRDAALSYAGLSMRLTTRLMQIASWLLVMRAIREEQMTYDEAAQDKYRLGTPEPDRARLDDAAHLDLLPARLMILREATAKLYERIVRIDGELFDAQMQPATPQFDAASRIATLRRVFPGE